MTDRRFLILIFACLLMLPSLADKRAEERGDSIYDRLVELSLKRDAKQLFQEKDAALALFAANKQWAHYYYVSALCSTVKVMTEGQTMTGLQECRKLYIQARDNNHDIGRGIVLAQIAWLYGFIGDHEESVKQMGEALRILRRYPMEREGIGLCYYYAYALELTKRYDEEARLLNFIKPIMNRYPWGDKTSIFYKTYSDNMLNAETLLEVRRGRLHRAGQLVDQLHTKLATENEQNPYEALRAIAEYYKAKGDFALALATTDRMEPLAGNSGLKWGLSLLRTEILRKLERSDEAYDQLRPMIDLRSSDRMGQLRQQLTEVETMTELDELRINRHRMQFWYAVGIGLIIIIGLCIYLVIRIRNSRRLKKANDQLKEAYNKLEETTTAKERIESELRIARNIQMSMVPSEFPTCDYLDLYATMEPAKEVGGDLYDVLLVDNAQLYFCVGDVSGKGVPASLFMAQTIRLFRAIAKLRTSPKDIATYLNNELSESNDSGMFVTMFIGMIELATGKLSFCNCGHNPPVIDCGSSKAEFIKMKPNVPLGLWAGITYEGEEIADIRNHLLFIYTDGLNEAENIRQEQFGDEHLLSILRQNTFSATREIIELMTTEVETYREDAEPSDDLTMLCLRFSS